MPDTPALASAIVDPIPMKCARCGKTMMLPRCDAPDLPDWVASMENTPCPDCDDGGFGVEDWFDAKGKARDPMGPRHDR